MPEYRRNRVAGGTYFFTVNLADRGSHLLVERIDLLRASVRRVRQLSPFHIDAWVVLPDHLHAVWTLPPMSIRSISIRSSTVMSPPRPIGPIRRIAV